MTTFWESLEISSGMDTKHDGQVLMTLTGNDHFDLAAIPFGPRQARRVGISLILAANESELYANVWRILNGLHYPETDAIAILDQLIAARNAAGENCEAHS